MTQQRGSFDCERPPAHTPGGHTSYVAMMHELYGTSLQQAGLILYARDYTVYRIQRVKETEIVDFLSVSLRDVTYVLTSKGSINALYDVPICYLYMILRLR